MKEVLTVIAKRGQQFSKNCGLDSKIQFRSLTNGEVAALDELPSAEAVMSLERGVDVLRYSDHDLQEIMHQVRLLQIARCSIH